MPCFTGPVQNNQIILVCSVHHQGQALTGVGQNQSQFNFRGLVDTGAQSSAISQNVVDQLSLSAVGWTDVTGVHGTVNTPIYSVDVGISVQETAADASGNIIAISAFAKAFPNRRVSLADFGSNSNFEVLLGMDIIMGCHLTVNQSMYTLCI